LQKLKIAVDNCWCRHIRRRVAPFHSHCRTRDA